MHDYPPRALALIDGLAEEMGIWLYPNLRLHNGTDGLEPLAAGYETAALAAAPTSSSPPTTTGGTTSPRTSTSAPSPTASASARPRSAASVNAGSELRPGVNPDCGVGFRLYSIRARAYS